MADEFVEVVNTTITSTELPSNNSIHTLKTAGANESFALKDIGIKTQSKIAQYSFLLNDFEVLSFSSGESGIASGLDLIPKSGTLKIKGKKIPIDSESVFFATDDVDTGTGEFLSLKERVFTPEFSRNDKDSQNFDSTFVTTDTFNTPYTGYTARSSQPRFAWRNGDRVRVITHQTSHTGGSIFDYSDTAGGSQIAITNKPSFEYVEDLNKIFYIDTGTSTIKVSNTDSNISFSTFITIPTGFSTLDRIRHCKGWIILVQSVHDLNPTIKAINITSGITLNFTGGNKGYVGANSTSTSMGLCFSYDVATDKIFMFRSSYATSNPVYITRHEFPKTLTEMNAYSSDTTISDSFSRQINSFTRPIASGGPFAYQYIHIFRGSTVNGNIFYLPTTVGRTIFYYDFAKNTLTELVGYDLDNIGSQPRYPLLQVREVSTSDETEYGGSFSNVDVRVTGIQTT
jgi:hypothetical protein